MKQTALALVAVAALFPAQAERKFTKGDQTRFVYFAVLEGLWEEGADRPALEALLKDPWKVFVPKCPNCMPVLDAIKTYLKDVPAMVYSELGSGFPEEIKTGLQSADRSVKLKALEAMVQRYVQRRFDRTVMTPGEKTQMINMLLMAKKYGMTIKEETFGDFCPSCNGATNFKK